MAAARSRRAQMREIERVFEFYTAADAILREEERRWYGFEIAEVIEAVLRVRNKLRERALDDTTAAKTVNELTDMLQKLGIGLVDTPWGTRWRWE